MKQHTFTRFIVVLTFCLCSCLSSFESIFGSMASGASPLPSKIYEAIVVKVIDGDTLEVKIKLWDDLEKTARLRIRGIDAPELRGKCRQEKILAKRARDHLRAFLGIQKARKKKKKQQAKVFLHNVQPGKYHREIADVFTAQGQNVADELVRAKLARRYLSGKRASWCPQPKAPPPPPSTAGEARVRLDEGRSA